MSALCACGHFFCRNNKSVFPQKSIAKHTEYHSTTSKTKRENPLPIAMSSSYVWYERVMLLAEYQYLRETGATANY